MHVHNIDAFPAQSTALWWRYCVSHQTPLAVALVAISTPSSVVTI